MKHICIAKAHVKPNPDLAKHIQWIYKKEFTLGSCSTADTARLEKLTGKTFKDSSHIKSL